MKFFPIVPLRYLSLASVSHNHMVLADYYIRYPKYRKFYLKMRERKDYIILDNSACELEKSVDSSVLLEVYGQLKPDILVIPDSNNEDNLDLFHHFLGNVLFKKPKWVYKTIFMAVPHSKADLVEMMKNNLVTSIGLNRQIDDLVGRVNIVKSYPNVNFHYLGFKKDPVRETKEVLGLNNVTGVDSLLPYRLARLGRRIEESRPFPPNLDLEEEGKLPKEILRHIKSELKWFINWVGEGRI